MSEELQAVSVQTKHSGALTVYVQGNADEISSKTVFLTVHDVGTNYTSFTRFVNDPSMVNVKGDAIFLHVSVPGQEANAPDFNGQFPSLQQLAEDLVCVLEKFSVKAVVAFGAGAGANVVTRFAIAFPSHILALILVHCTSTTAGVVEYLQDKVANLALESGGMTDGAWEYLAHHVFGVVDGATKKQFVTNLKATFNPKNLSKYLLSFSQRTDLSGLIGTELEKVDVLLVTGSKAPHLHTVHTTAQKLNKKRTTLLVADNVADVLTEAPDHLARALVLFAKGVGVLGGVPIPGLERQRTLSGSMEEADRPRHTSTTQAPNIQK